MSITIWNTDVSNIYVGSTPIQEVYVWSTKVRPTQLSDERIEIKMMADNSGNLKIPVAWVSASGSRNSPYNWKVSVDWWTATTKSWTTARNRKNEGGSI